MYLHIHTCSDMTHTYVLQIYVHSLMTTHTCPHALLLCYPSPPITNTHIPAHTLTRLLLTNSHLSGESYQMYHTMGHLHVWLMVCSLPLEGSTRMDQLPLPSMPSTILIRSGSMLETCHLSVPMWTHYFCQEGGCWWLMVVLVDRCWRSLWKVSHAVMELY